MFFLDNPGLWCFLVNYLADTRLEDPKLPDGVHLSVTVEAPKLRVEVNRVPPLPKVEDSIT
jgi:nitrogen fixation protein